MGVVGMVNFFSSGSFVSTDLRGLFGTGMEDTDLVLWGTLLAPALVLRDGFPALPIIGLPLGAGNLEKDPERLMLPFWMLATERRSFFGSTSLLFYKMN